MEKDQEMNANLRGGSRIDGRGVLRLLKSVSAREMFVPRPLLMSFPHT